MEKKVFIIFALILALSACSNSKIQDTESKIEGEKNTILGSSFTPANLPSPSDKDIQEFFILASQIGSHVTLITEWKDNMNIEDIKTIQSLTRKKGMKFHLHLSPIALENGRKNAAVPNNVLGKSFGDLAVREAYKKMALELASINPDYLGLGTEVNFLAQNPQEFSHYVTLTQEAYSEIKEKYPSQTVTISFQWDIIITQKQFDVLPLFGKSLDVYSFTTYPSFFENPQKIPTDYYSSVRRLLPNERIGFSEVGWNSEMGSSEDIQSMYYSMIPKLMKEAKPEYVTLGLLHDVFFFEGDMSSLNSVGIRKQNGEPKKSWDIVLNLEFNNK